MVKALRPLLFLMLGYLMPGLVQAQTDPVVVTATRTAQTVDASLAAVSVINRDQIDRLQPASVTEILQSIPGLSVSNTGGLGQPSTVFLRGSEFDHVLVLIDGIKVGSVTLGATAFQYLDPDQIERIEVVRGPRSSLYGSDAIGGVIQIFTRDPAKSTGVSVSASAGTHDYSKVGVRLSTGRDSAQFTFGINREKTKGYNVCKGSYSGGCWTFEDDRDGYESLSVQAGFHGSLNEKVDLSLSYLSSNGETEYDGSFSNETDVSLSVVGATLDVMASDLVAMTFAAGQSQDDSDTHKDGVFVDRFDTTRTSFSWQNDISVSLQNLVTVGVDLLQDKVNSTTSYAVNSRDNLGLFAQYLGNVSAASFQAALRYDDNEQFGGQITGDTSIGYDAGPSGRWTLQYGTAFKAPTFNELYYPGYGNANLSPEESSTIETGYRWRDARRHWAVNVYMTEVDQLISYDAASAAPGNVDAARISGAELDAGMTVRDWRIGATLAVLSAKQDRGAYDGKALPRRPGETLELRLDRDYGKLSVGGSVFSSASSYDDLANTRVISSYTTANLRGSYRFSSDGVLVAKVINLTDEDYEHASYYRQPGREFFLGLKWIY